jgi:YHS domain-containing protein
MEGLGSLLLFAVFFYVMMRFGCGAHMIHGHGGHSGQNGHAGANAPKGDRKDPVCGMEVAEGEGYSKMHLGRQLRFCSRKCLDQFESSPGRYVTQTGAAL